MYRNSFILQRSSKSHLRWLRAISILALVANFFSATTSLGTTSSNRPNILFILTEDQGPHAGCYGTKGLKTPHMDSLAASGTRFTEAFVVYPVCSPSKAALYTGLYAAANGLRANTMNYHKPAANLSPAEEASPVYQRVRITNASPTLVELLRAADYHTVVTHKLHVAPNERFPYHQFLGGATGKTMRQALEASRAARRPWFVLYNLPETHRPWRNSETSAIRVDPTEVQVPGFLPDTPVVRRDVAEYYDSIERADELIGEALEVVRQAGQDTNTIVVFMGDHGPCFQRGKMSPYDYGLRVPLIISGPGLKRAAVSAALVAEIDLLPTLLDLIGMTPPAVHGRSLKSILTQGRGGGHDYVVGEIYHGAQQGIVGMQERAIYDGRYRLIYRERVHGPRQFNEDLWRWQAWGNRAYDETIAQKENFPAQYELLRQLHPQRLGGKPPVLELYDVKNDPFELRNIAADATQAAILERLRRGLMEWVVTVGDPFLQTNLLAEAKP
jgi:N-sulfoglucosamine sulfohydrolase